MTETSPSSGLLASLRRAKEDLTIGCGHQQRSLLALHEAVERQVGCTATVFQPAC